jgi:autotransporter translocation and assembly factor TamB
MQGEGSGTVNNGTIANAVFELATDSTSSAKGRSLSATVAGSYSPDSWVLDSLSLIGAGYFVNGRGRVDARSRGLDSIGVRIEVSSLAELWPVAVEVLGEKYALDSVPTGTIWINTSISGTPAEPELEFDLRAEQIAGAGYGAGLVNAAGSIDPSRNVELSGRVHSLTAVGRIVDRISLDVAGNTESAAARIGALLGQNELATSVRLESADEGRLITLDSMTVRHASDAWRSRRAAAILAGSGRVHVDSLILDGPHSRVVVAGGISKTDTSTLTLRMESVPVRALASIISPDTAWSVAGVLDASMNVRGPLSNPRGEVEISTDSSFINRERVPDAVAHLVVTSEGTDLNLVLEDDSSLVATGRLPIRFETEAFGVALEESRAIDLKILVNAADVSRLEPLLANIEDPRGEIAADIRLRGTIQQPDVSGSLGLRRGYAYMPSLDVEYSEIELTATLDGARARVDSLLLGTANGWLRAEGAIDLTPLHDPTLDLAVVANDFQAISDESFLTLTATGDIAIGGRLRAPTATGELTAERAVLRFADVIEKDVIDLNNPLYAGVVDTAIIRREGLQPGLMKHMQDSLVLDSLVVTLGSDVWLRSEDANVQLGGEAAISKVGDRYQVLGTFLARRGTYQLALGPAVTREFQIIGGSVRYFGDPSRDANLDIDASHTVRTFRGDQVEVFANIGGTMAEPKVTLSSSLGPRISDTEIISYLLFGAPSVQVFAGRSGREEQSVFQRSAQQLANFLSGTLERSLTDNLGVPVDYLRINPGDVNRGFSSAELLVGKQIDLFGRPAFLTASPRLCPSRGLISLKTTGASLETWLAGEWLASASIDPVRTCEINPTGTTSYSVGADLFWEKH